MIIITSFDETHFTLNGVKFAKIYQPLAQGSIAIGLYSIYDTKQQLVNSTIFSDFQIDGSSYASQTLTIAAILDVIYNQVSSYDIDLLDVRVSDNEAAVINLDSRVDGNENDIVDIDSRVDNLESNQVTGVETYETLASLPGTGTLLVSYKVTNDGTSSNNGYYHWNGSIYVKDASTVLNTFDENNNSDAFSGVAIALHDKEKINDNNVFLLDSVPSWYSDYLADDAISDLKSHITLQNDGDYFEAAVILRDLGATGSTAQSMGIAGKANTSGANIGVYNSGQLYIKDDVSTWLTTAGFINPATIDNKELIIRLEWNASDISVYKNGIFQKSITKGVLTLENFGFGYNITAVGSYNGLIRDIKISHSGGTLVNIKSPIFSIDLLNNVNVTDNKGDDVFLTAAQSQQLKDHEDEITILKKVDFAECYITYDPIGTTGGNKLFRVYVKNKSEQNDVYYKYTLLHEIDASELIYQNLYRIKGAIVCVFDGTTMTANGDLVLNNGESEFVYFSNGSDDFTGGFHGNELLTEVNFYVDKVRLTASELSSSFDLLPCSEFQYIQKSTMHEAPQGGVANPLHPLEAIHHKNTTFKNSGYETKNRLIWQKSLNLDIAYIAIASLRHDLGEYGQTVNYNIATFDRLGGRKLEDIGKEVHIWNETKGYSATVICESDVYNDTSTIFIWDTSTYNKFYRDTGAKAVINAEEWNANFIVKMLKD